MHFDICYSLQTIVHYLIYPLLYITAASCW